MKNIKNKQKGYALLFVIVIISIIAAITAGLASTTLKQQILSSAAKDSQAAFYASDTATECALYAHYNYDRIVKPLIDADTWTCGKQVLFFKNHGGSDYSLTPSYTSNEPCFSIESSTSSIGGKDETIIISRGYNYCKENNPRRVERAIKATITTIPE